jgi:hypothetical protein
MDIKLYKDKIDLIIDEMNNAGVLDRVRNFTTVIALLDIIKSCFPENGYVREKASIITASLENLACLDHGNWRPGSEEITKAKNALQDLVDNLST